MIDFLRSSSTSQVAGRTVILKTHDGHLLKPIEQPIEANFYAAPPSTLLGVIPQFYGFHPFTPELMDQIVNYLEEGAKANPAKEALFATLAKKVKGRNYTGLLELEDVTAGMARPCVMDAKISFSRHSRSREVLQKDNVEGSTIVELGFLLSGMQCYLSNEATPTFHSRGEMINLNLEQTRERVVEFFNVLQSNAIIDLAIAKSQEVGEILRNTHHYRLRSASVLIAFDADSPELMRAKLIDFGKVDVSDDLGNDVDLLESLNNFIRFLEGSRSQAA
eukprot:CAMPEP_0204896432 /NCGR_PEP_ID=MMETSP1397-20131031/158_1 /ASSEMBLY_ACC=CAM_ASM_000891 /TAXON_ID=49980 /ORGANISM="Climacostomum Climacostomum virens, Strain Stock W-24" /LENGTH=276 /DNA_ID=CAMNT_0052064035 /DNA_START=33 /DNA_END=863 /DNA_ORIENTATION=+